MPPEVITVHRFATSGNKGKNSLSAGGIEIYTGEGFWMCSHEKYIEQNSTEFIVKESKISSKIPWVS